MPSLFYKKSDALEFIKRNPDLKLFSEDISTDNKKRFITCSYDYIHGVSKQDKNHYYENIEQNQSVKLHFDLDHKLNSDEEDTQLFDLDEIIKEINNLLKNYDIDNQEVIILTACTNEKESYHIIYKNVVFDDIYKMKYFTQDLKNKYIDKLIYRTGCFRLLWSSKINKNNKLRYFNSINYEFKDDKTLFYDCLLLNLPEEYNEIDIEIPENQKSENNQKNKDKNNNNNKTYELNTSNNFNLNYDLAILRKYVNCLSSKRADNYKDWVDIGMCLFNTDKKSFEIWHEFSKKSKSYTSKNDCIYKWNSFSETSNSKQTIGTLISYASLDNPIEFSYIKKPFDENYKPKRSYLKRQFIQSFIQNHN